jgi:hypothetical protein
MRDTVGEFQGCVGVVCWGLTRVPAKSARPPIEYNLRRIHHVARKLRVNSQKARHRRADKENVQPRVSHRERKTRFPHGYSGVAYFDAEGVRTWAKLILL